jgi:hypothetical protein
VHVQLDNHHASEEVLERYSMDRLAEPELAGFEEHLLVCESCQDRLAREDSIRHRVRAGCAVLQPLNAATPRLPKLAWALGLAALGLVIAGVQSSIQDFGAPRAVVLFPATRGAETAETAGAPAGIPLILMLDLTGLPPLSQYRLEIVDEHGHSAFQTRAVPGDNKLRATVGKGLPDGAYYVRVYRSQELLREYALEVR